MLSRIELQDKSEGRLLQVLLSLYFAISIFEPYLNGTLGSLTKYYIFIVMIALCVGMKIASVRIRVVVFTMFLWLAIKTTSLIWSQDYTTPQLHWLSQYGMVAFLAVMLIRPLRKSTIRQIVNTYWLSSGLLGVLSLLFSRSYHSTIGSRQVVVLFGAETDPNNQAALLMVGIAISVFYLAYEKKHRVLAATILLINLYACFLTASRSGLMTAIVIAVCSVLVSKEKMSFADVSKRILVVALLAIVSYFVVTRFLPAASYNRLFVNNYMETDGRSILWGNVWSVYISNPLYVFFGAGWGTATITTGATVAAHNTFLTLLMDSGLVGTILFLAPIVIMVKRCSDNRMMLPLLLILAAFIPAFFIDAINKRFFWNAIILACVIYYNLENAKLAFSEEGSWLIWIRNLFVNIGSEKASSQMAFGHEKIHVTNRKREARIIYRGCEDGIDKDDGHIIRDKAHRHNAGKAIG